MSVPEDVGNFADCLDQNNSVSIPLGIVLGISLISNICLCVRLIYVQKRSLLEESIELGSIFSDSSNLEEGKKDKEVKKSEEPPKGRKRLFTI